jgi:hypothetical protein
MAREPRIPPELTAHLKLLSLTDVDSGELRTVRIGLDTNPLVPLKAIEVWQERVARGEDRPIKKWIGRPPKSKSA